MIAESLRLGNVGGIPVGLNWSLAVIFALVTAGLSRGLFPELFPDHQPAVYLAAGLATAVLFFLSILAHELGHALLARRKGVEVEGVTLWLFGGVARFASEPSTPGDELRIAAVGPLISLLLGAGFAIVSTLTSGVAGAEIVAGLTWWLAILNVVLAVFNLVPAAPLDGGRILRALLWHRRGDRVSAAAAAARAGRAFGVFLVGVGLLEFAFLPGLGGLWLMLLGWFLLTAARSEETHSRLQGIRVADVMSPDPVTGPDWLTVSDFLDEYVWRHRFSTFPLVSFDERLVGVVTLRALKRVPAGDRVHTRVRDVACPLARTPTCQPDEELVAVLPRLAVGCSDGRALVMDGDRLVGILSPTDLARVTDLADLHQARREPHLS